MHFSTLEEMDYISFISIVVHKNANVATATASLSKNIYNMQPGNICPSVFSLWQLSQHVMHTQSHKHTHTHTHTHTHVFSPS